MDPSLQIFISAVTCGCGVLAVLLSYRKNQRDQKAADQTFLMQDYGRQRTDLEQARANCAKLEQERDDLRRQLVDANVTIAELYRRLAAATPKGTA